MSIIYPDVLGYITGGVRLQAGALQCAATVHPRILRAGRPFDAILLLQNCNDSLVSVTATLTLPDADAKKQKNRFLCQQPQQQASLSAGEVGYIRLPALTMPDTATSDGYKLAFNVDAKSTAGANRLRPNEGGAAITLEYLPQAAQEAIEGLRKLTFGAARRGLFGVSVETGFSLMSGSGGALPNSAAAWVSLWTMRDHPDEAALFDFHRQDLMTALPLLKRDKLAAALTETTQARFSEGGFDLHPAELRYIVKLLLCVVELASPRESTLDYLGGEHLNIANALQKLPAAGTLKLPSWCKGFLRLLQDEPDAATRPIEALAGVLYDELLRDAVLQGCRMIPKLTGDSLGSDDDIRAYADGLVRALVFQERPLILSDVYLPLLIGGLAWFDRALVRDERLVDDLLAMVRIVDARNAESSDDDALILRMTGQVLQRALHSYGLNP